ncbi:MAG: FAD-dependent oxidoreductase [Coriobacteriales bacterium]|jgi:succinate dehydrogenase/fumarate reductase flavoprotein subunit|nr:FAD-dependent oxidoreductase [Coriobacteriales bacterium]
MKDHSGIMKSNEVASKGGTDCNKEYDMSCNNSGAHHEARVISDTDGFAGSISRRSFLSGIGATGALVAASAIVGCAPTTIGGANSGANSGTNSGANGTANVGTNSGGASGAASGALDSAGWRMAPAAPEASKISETVDVDVVIVGGGSSGLGAGRSALLHGAKKIIVLEKNESSRVGGGVHGILGSKYAREIGIDFSKELVNEMIKEEMQVSGMRADERYYRLWAQRSEEVFQSMLEAFDSKYVHCVNNGAAPYNQLADEYFSESVYPGEALQVSEGDVNTPVIDGFTNWINNNGGEVRYKTGGEQVIMKDGKVAGVYAKKEDGTYLQVNAKAVVVSSGGFEGNEEMLAELAPHVIGTNIANTVPGDGSGIKMCVWAGAQTQMSPCCIMMSSAKSPDDPNVPNPIPFICVNKNGERFVNEATSSFLIPYAILNQPQKKAWQIFDANYAQTINDLKIQTWMGTIFFNEEKIKKFEDAATKADTLAELAQKLGIDADGLTAQIKKYDAMQLEGHDDQYGVPHRFMTAVNPVQAPFYGMEIPYNTLVSLGGVICKPETSEVLDQQNMPIPGLYASGNTVGNRFGAVYSNNTCGLSNGFGDVGGYVAGESAGEYISKI